MKIFWIIVLFLCWYLLALILSEKYHNQCRIGRQWLFFTGIVASPLVAFVLIKLFPKNKI